MTLNGLIGRALYEAKSIVAMYPTLAVPLARRRGAGHGKVFDRDTDIVIEGFPRSGNVFAVAAFRHAQEREVRIANRVHAPGHVIGALDAGLPVVVLIREPEESVLGWVVYKGNISIGQALRAYRRFYAPLIPHRDRFVTAPFDEVTADFGGVIRRVNERFGTSFAEFDHTKENVHELFRHMESYVTAHRGPEDAERFLARPSAERERMKEGLRASYRAPRLARSRRKAEVLYRAFTSVPRERQGPR
jgi:hypothetical protein